ncbi:MAG: hypothetical protein K2M07_00385 [Muribaculaceae bacterium]|nr:hypothetical protein [Muribaculaceae bacterium]
MKKSILLLPLFAIGLLLSSCESDSDYWTYRQSQVDTDEITEAVNDALREAFQNTNFNDTIFNCDEEIMTKTIMITAGDSISSGIQSVMPKMPDIKISVNNNNNDWLNLQREKNEQRSVVAIVSVVIPCVMIVLIAAIILLFFYFRMRNRNKVIEAAIAANYHLPAEFYNNSVSHNNLSEVKTAQADGTVPPPLPRNERLRVNGLRLVSIGLGLIIMLGVWGGLDAAVIGVIPLLIGGSYLANYYNILK